MPNDSTALVLFALALTSSGASAPLTTTRTSSDANVERDLVQDFSELHRLTLEGALELVEWANEKKYFSARNALYETVLVYDPENVPALKALGYRREEGKWVPGKRREVIDSCKPRAREEFEVQRRDVVLRLCAELDRLFEGVAATPATRRALRREHQRILLIAPNSPDLRARLGEVWDVAAERFVLGETATTRATRDAFAKRLDEVRAALPTLEPELAPAWASAVEGVSFDHCRRGGGITLVSSLSAEEVEALLNHALVAREVVRAELARGANIDRLEFVHVLAGPGEMRTYLGQHPSVPPSSVNDLMSGPMGWIDAELIVLTTASEARPAMVAYQSIHIAAMRAFAVPRTYEWLEHGIAGSWCAAQTGTRRAEFDLAELPSVANELARLPADAHARTRWLRAARALLERDGLEILESALLADAKSARIEYQVVASAVAQFLLEARRGDLFELVDRARNGEEVLAALEASLELSTVELVEVLMRWIDELEPIAPVETPAAKSK